MKTVSFKKALFGALVIGLFVSADLGHAEAGRFFPRRARTRPYAARYTPSHVTNRTEVEAASKAGELKPPEIIHPTGTHAVQKP
ncbi:hypothetical protein [Planctomicrobium piriforme]|uniref:Uncharacterized protein n=1 Tax=Planctomicrobium piriforme TaxID=1576369 RepID=A0A1I3CHX9_9PLAN|nr:hypothetical protein [Planctomicrobium piriforme]SFH73936.1 hypothetical protein SAMN05421753_102285 [Planctomicrobium piriforme]